ncbi:MAG: penicillin-binding protein 2, partial [Alkalinema sp. FL-bin-369]|nr:penicillin-binding protein 2 [Leptolyngbyaceae cyanobacterium LF-bin-369]
MQFSQNPDQQRARKVGRKSQSVVMMMACVALIVGGLGGRIAYLQLLEGTQNRQRAENNRVRLIAKMPERGRILDRKGRVLAGTRLTHSVYLWPLALKQTDWGKTLSKLSVILNVPEADIKKRLEREGYQSASLVKVARNISPQQITALAEASNELPGVQVDGETSREYIHGDLAVHVLGYTGELTDENYVKLRNEGYRLGDVIGKMGIEATYEKQLRGEGGGQQVEVDGTGQVVRVLKDKPSRSGKDITLTLDLDLQKAAAEALNGVTGSIVAIDPKNGAVLALVSNPGFDPNIFTRRVSQEMWNRLTSLNDPFLNRSLQTFPPASTFKIVTTVAAIESGKFTGDEVFQTYPSLTIAGTTFGEWNHAGFGPLGFPGAMANSSDTFFYQVAQEMGGAPIIDWSRRFGLGALTGIDLVDEVDPGLVPDAAWKLKHEKIAWSIGDTVNMSIGQGALLTSPLQVAMMFSVAANGGFKVKPHLLKDNEEAHNWREDLKLKPKTLEVLKEGLRGVIDYGTGNGLKGGAVTIAGKSGTAEDLGDGSHTWFGAYGPTEKPEIVVVAFGERTGGGGGSLMGPKAKQVVEAYFAIKNGTHQKSQN